MWNNPLSDRWNAHMTSSLKTKKLIDLFDHNDLDDNLDWCQSGLDRSYATFIISNK